MPTPLELLLDPLTLSVIAIFAVLALWEAMFPARELPRVRGWRTKGLLAFAAYLAISSYLPFLWADWLAPFQLFDLSTLSTLARATIGVVAYEAGVWAWHRSLHGSEPAVALFAPVASQRRASRYLGRILVQPARHGGPHCSVSRSRWWVSRRRRCSRPCASPHFSRSSSTPTCARRAGWVCWCSVRKATRGTMRAVCMPEIIPICRCSTSCQVPGTTRATSRPIRVFITAPRRNTAACCWDATLRPAEKRHEQILASSSTTSQHAVPHRRRPRDHAGVPRERRAAVLRRLRPAAHGGRSRAVATLLRDVHAHRAGSQSGHRARSAHLARMRTGARSSATTPRRWPMRIA